MTAKGGRNGVPGASVPGASVPGARGVEANNRTTEADGASTPPGRTWARAGWLGLVSGTADAAGWIGSGVFAAHMTGNTALIGVALLAGDWRHAAIRAAAIGCFAAGLLMASAIGQASAGGTRIAVAVASCFALGAAFVPGAHTHVLLLAVALAMQNAALRQFAGKAINTSFLTGDIQQWTSAFLRGVSGRRTEANRDADRVVMRIVPLIWVSYVVGAALGATLAKTMRHPLLPVSIAIPVVLLLLGDGPSPAEKPAKKNAATA